MAKLSTLKVKIDTGSGGTAGTSEFLFQGNAEIYKSSALSATKSGVTVATKTELASLKVVNTVEQLIVAGVAERLVARGIKSGKQQNRHFIVARGKAEAIEAEIEATDAGVDINGLTCKSASTPRNYGLIV